MVISFSQSLTWQSPVHGWTRTPWSCSSLLWRLRYTFRHQSYSSSWFHPVVGEASLPNRWRSDLIIRWKAMYGDQAHIQLQFSRGACLRTPVDIHMPTLITEPLPTSFNPGWNTDHKMLTGSMSISVPGCDPQVELEHPYRQRVGSIWQPCRVTPPQAIILKQEKNNVLHYSNT